ncbi:MAG: winged helix-turn-helix transcriptional regulator [Candidatus Altiarchaeota archaeon]
MRKEKIKQKIIEILKKFSKPISKREIARLLKISPATASKYVDILAAEGMLEVKNYGNINLVELKKK